MNLTSKPRRCPNVQIEPVNGELLLYAPASQQVLALNPAAALIWNLCDGERSVAQIIQLLCAAYPEASAEIPPQVQETLDNLLAQQALDSV